MNIFLRLALATSLPLASGFAALCQEVAQPSAAASVGKSEDKLEITKKDLLPLETSWHGRLGRAFQYTYQLGEQPRTVLVGSGSTATFIPNPEHYLKQHSLTFQFSELFTNSSDKSLVIKHAYQGLSRKPGPGQQISLSSDLCGRDDAITCSAKGTTVWGRLLSGVKLGIALSERPAVQQQVIVPETFGNHYSVAGQVDFDPASLLLTAQNYKDALTNLADINIAISNDCFSKEKMSRIDRKDKDKSLDVCRKRLFQSRISGNALNGRAKWDAFLQMALPVFQFKRITQFDFVKNGGILIPAPFPESGLNNYTFTWDLRRWIAPTKVRLTTEDTIALYKPKPQGSKFCIIVSGTQENYISVADSFKIKNCSELAASINAPLYRLGCMSEVRNDSAGEDPNSKKSVMMVSERPTPTAETTAPPKGDACGW